MQQAAASDTLAGITRAIEFLTSAMRAAVTGGDGRQLLVWARDEVEAMIEGRHGQPTIVVADYITPRVPPGYDTILGYLATTSPEMLELMEEPVADTCRDGWWLRHRCRERGDEPIKVMAPRVCQDRGIEVVNAYPLDLLERRFG